MEYPNISGRGPAAEESYVVMTKYVDDDFRSTISDATQKLLCSGPTGYEAEI